MSKLWTNVEWHIFLTHSVVQCIGTMLYHITEFAIPLTGCLQIWQNKIPRDFHVFQTV